MNHTDLAPAAPSFRERIAGRRAYVAAPAAAAALALGALAPATAEAAIYTVASPSASNLNFDPLDGSSAPGYFQVSADNPIFLGACFGALVALHAPLANSNTFHFFGPDPEGFSGIIPVGAGVTIDASGVFHEAGLHEYATAPASYDDTTLHYIGIRYTNQGPGSNETYYGWIEYTMPGEESAVLTRYALGGNGQAIVTGQDVSAIPEPSAAAALLGALALGATCTRRRRR